MTKDFLKVYLVAGLLDSGKTTFIEQALQNGHFPKTDSTVLIQCEDGECELEDPLLKEYNVTRLLLDDPADLTEEYLDQLRETYTPQQLIIECNGMYPLSDIAGTCTFSRCYIEEITVLIDASMFRVCLLNMTDYYAELITRGKNFIFNRCRPDLPLAEYRRFIIGNNTSAVFEFEGGGVSLQSVLDTPITFPEKDGILEISDDDYPIWFLDMREHPERYRGRRVRFQGTAASFGAEAQGRFLVYRQAASNFGGMYSYQGISCTAEPIPPEAAGNKWVQVTGNLSFSENEDFSGALPQVAVESICEVPAPEVTEAYFLIQ